MGRPREVPDDLDFAAIAAVVAHLGRGRGGSSNDGRLGPEGSEASRPRDDRAVKPPDVRVSSGWRDLHLQPLSARPREQPVCAIQLRLLQHFNSAIATPDKTPRRTSLLTAFGLARTNGLPLELCGPASHLAFLLRASVRRHRRAQGGSPMRRSIRPTRAQRAFMRIR